MSLESPLSTPTIPDRPKVSRVDPRGEIGGREAQSPLRSSSNNPFRFRADIESTLLIPPLKAIPNSEMDRFGDMFGKKFLGSTLDQFLFRDVGFWETMLRDGETIPRMGSRGWDEELGFGVLSLRMG